MRTSESEAGRRAGTAAAAASVWMAAVAMLLPAAGFAAPPQAAGPASQASVAAAGLPFVYTDWEQFTTAEGLPDDHVLAVKVQGDLVWIGTEHGLACLDKKTGAMRTWGEEDGLPWRVISSLDFDPATGDLWIGMLGGGVARFSGGRFDHFNQLNSGLVNDVVYGLGVVAGQVWVATTAGASRFDPATGEWAIYNEKNSPMEEIWNYGVTHGDGKVFLAVWGSGILEHELASGRWKEYLDPDGEMEIDLYRDDGIVHVITTSASYVDETLWVGTYFGASRYDGRRWRGYYAHESGLPSDFINGLKGRSAREAWFATDKGLGVLADAGSDTWVTYTRDGARAAGRAVIQRGSEVLKTVETGLTVPHNYVLWVEFDGEDAWVGTSKGLARAIGAGGRRLPRPERAGGGKAVAASAYEVPALPKKTDKLYAGTRGDVQPYGKVEPYKRHFLEQMEYTGPGRAVPDPVGLKTVRIGFIGPLEPTVSVATGGRTHDQALGRQMLQGSRLAVEEANAAGGYGEQGLPFELVVDNDNGLWGASGNTIVKQAYNDGVWAILGSIDGANSHIAIRTALKAEVLMMNTGDTDPTFVETNIPWVARVIGDDRQMGYLLVDYLYRKRGFEKVAIIRASSRYGRFGVREVRDGSRRLGHPIVTEMAYPVGSGDYTLQLERVARARPDAVVHWGDGEDGGRILKQMRAMGMQQPFFGCDRTVSADFVAAAGKDAEGVMAPFPWNPHRESEKLEAFRRRFRERFGEEPDTFAAHAYDGMSMLIWAVQSAGLNRARIRDAVAARTEPWPGVSGDIPLSAVLDDVGPVYMARYDKGGWTYLSRQDLELPALPAGAGAADAAAAPHVSHRQRSLDIGAPAQAAAGAADGVAAAATAEEVVIGYFGPAGSGPPEQTDLWHATQLAVEQANAGGGLRGRPYRLQPAWSQSPWGTGVAELTRLAYDPGVSALIGSVDGSATHLAEQVVAKARLPLVSPVSTDTSVNMAGVPWAFSLMPPDDLQAEVLAAAVSEAGTRRLALLAVADHDSRVAAGDLRRALQRRGLAPVAELTVGSGASEPEAAQAVGRLLDMQPEAVAVLAGAADGGRLVRALREKGFDGAIYGGAGAARRSFVLAAGEAAEGVVVPILCDGAADEPLFAEPFRRRAGHAPDCAARQAYDAAHLLLQAIDRAGSGRDAIREALAGAAPWRGDAGEVVFNGLGENQRPVRLGRIERGVPVPVPGG